MGGSLGDVTLFRVLPGGDALADSGECQNYIVEFECMNLGMLVTSRLHINFHLSLFHLSLSTSRPLKKCIM